MTRRPEGAVARTADADPGTVDALVVAGATASGKSALALALAERLGGVVINADSQQVYRGLPVLTACPGAAERARAPHRLYGVLDPDEACSAARWRSLALEAIRTARSEGRRAILCGGTGLYIRALARGLAPVPEIPPATRRAATALHAALGGAGFRALLAARDPEAARTIRASDRQRLIRAFEVIEATGRPLAEWQAEAPGADAEPAPRLAALVLLPARADLAPAIAGRFHAMLAAGALDEVRALLARGLDPSRPALKAVGVPELVRHLRGEVDLAAASTAAIAATMRYAKRQSTWFRHQTGRDIPLHRTIVAQYSERLLPGILTFIREFWLTGSRTRD